MSLDRFIDKRIEEKVSSDVRRGLTQGNSISSIKKALLAEGYDEQIIDKAISRYSFASSLAIDDSTFDATPMPQDEKSRPVRPNSQPLSVQKPLEARKESLTPPLETKKAETRENGYSYLYFSFSRNPHFMVFLLSILLFFIVTAYVLLNGAIDLEKGNCPKVLAEDTRLAYQLYLNNNPDFDIIELTEILEAYMGREECTFISKSTIRELRSYKYEDISGG